jgi:hypothetical protein
MISRFAGEHPKVFGEAIRPATYKDASQVVSSTCGRVFGPAV